MIRIKLTEIIGPISKANINVPKPTVPPKIHPKITTTISIDNLIKYSKILDENNINYNKPSRVSKENSQFKEAKKLNAEYLINADEDTIKNLITNETEAFDIEVILEH